MGRIITRELDEYDSHSPIEERPWTAGNPPLGYDAEHVEPTIETEDDDMKGQHMSDPHKDERDVDPNEDHSAFGDDDHDETYVAGEDDDDKDKDKPDLSDADNGLE